MEKKKSIKVEDGFFFKMNKRDSTFIREMRVPVVCTAYTTKAKCFKTLSIIAKHSQIM